MKIISFSIGLKRKKEKKKLKFLSKIQKKINEKSLEDKNFETISRDLFSSQSLCPSSTGELRGYHPQYHSQNVLKDDDEGG